MPARTRYFVGAVTLSTLLGAFFAFAQAPQGGGAPPVQHPMTFFVTSVGLGKGADLGGLAGADAHCLALATAVGAGNHTWHAYMSTQGPNAVNARDRIGAGPWYNAKNGRIAQDVGDLHGDTLDQARLGNALGKQSALTEKGAVVNGVGDMPNTHDMLTGSKPDGTPIPTPWITLATIGPAVPPARRSLVTPTATVAGTPRGIRRTPAAAAARTT